MDPHSYARLEAIAKAWENPGEPLAAEQMTVITQLLYKECRLLDDQRFEDWLQLFVEQCIYWIPGDVIPQNPAGEITWEIHDRRRLEDRVARLRTGTAFSQLPPTRTQRSLSNLEAWTAADDEIRVRSNLIIHTYRKGVHQQGTHRVLPCRCGYVLKKVSNHWLIEIKQINLIDADEEQGNNSFFL